MFINCSRPFLGAGGGGGAVDLAFSGLSYALGIPTSLASPSISASLQLDAHPTLRQALLRHVPSRNEGTRERQDISREHISPTPSTAWHLLDLVVISPNLRLELEPLEQT